MHLQVGRRQYEKRELIKNEHESKIAFDRSFAPFDGALIAGVDEAGRGPLAGPVVTAAVILPDKTEELIGLDDSKAISKANREHLAEKIRRCCDCLFRSHSISRENR